MIQRIQSLFLAGVFLGHLSLFFMGFATFNHSDKPYYEYSLYGFHKFDSEATIVVEGVNTTMLLIMNVVIMLLAGFIISRFKNRKLQMRLCSLLLLLGTIFTVLMLNGLDHSLQAIEVDYSNVDFTYSTMYGLGLAMPILGIVFSALALRYIKKDEELVRAADRIR
jgi:hypothetical protein